MLKPKPLRPGDTIGLVGISGALQQAEEKYPRMMEAIEAMGYKVIVADSCREVYGYLSGTDASRARGLNRMFADDRVDAVVCMDQMTVDVTDIPGVKPGDAVTLLGDGIGVNEYAAWTHANRNEMLSRLGRRVPRVYMRRGEAEEIKSGKQ